MLARGTLLYNPSVPLLENNDKLQRFESLGDNCELLSFLRESGYDEGSLFRWTLIKNYHALLKLIESDFAGLYVYENLTPILAGYDLWINSMIFVSY